MNSWAAFANTSPHSLWVAGAVTLAFASLARWVRGVSPSGAVAGAAVCFLLCAGAGLGAFCALVSVFVLTWVATRFGYQRKQKLGTAESREGRTAAQVLANLSVSAGCTVLWSVTGRTAFLWAMVAALSEAAADTVSSELGQARQESARLITNWQTVPAGTDGGVTALGTVAGIAAATLVSSVGAVVGLVPARLLWLPILAGTLGMLADSYMGAVLERRRLLNNNWVNFLGTLTAAALALATGLSL